MKTFKSVIAVAIMAAAMLSVESVYAQDSYTKKEKREMARDIKASSKDLYKKSDKDVRKSAKQLKKQGWQTMDLPIEKQLERTWERMWQTDAAGYDKYISKTTSAIGQSYTAAVRQAESVAKLGIASDMGTLIQSMLELAIGNKELTPKQAVSVNQSAEKVKMIVNQKLGRVLTSMTLYREKGDVYEVRVSVLYSQQAALEAANQAAKEVLKDDMEMNAKDFDALFGYEKLREQYDQGNWDETIE